MLRLLGSKLPYLLRTPVRYSLISYRSYAYKDVKGDEIKETAKKRILSRLGEKAKDIPEEVMNLMIGEAYQELKGSNSQKAEDLLVNTISDKDFFFPSYMIERFLVPLYAVRQQMTKEAMESRSKQDYYPDTEDEEIVIKVPPPKGIHLKHFTEIIPESVRLPINILDMLPDNGICVTSLPNSFKEETLKNLFGVYGSIAKWTIIHDINSNFSPHYRLSYVCCDSI